MAHAASSGMAEEKFSFEDLEVWQEAVEFADRCLDVTDRINDTRRHYRLLSQLESAAVSPALNIAEGKGRYSKKEFVQFLYVARVNGRPWRATQGRPMVSQRRTWPGPSQVVCPDLYAVLPSCFGDGLLRC